MLLRTRGVVSCLAMALFCPFGWAQLIDRVGVEYAISGPLLGDQTHPAVSVRPSGGYVVWQDNFVDGDGLGIGARRLDGSLSPTPLAAFRVNQQTLGNQENPQVCVLPTGAAAVVWQGGLPAYQNIWLRALSTNGTFTTTNDIRLNTYTNGTQLTPVICALARTNYAVAWASMHQDGSFQGVYMRLVGPDGQLLSNPVQVNQIAAHNQRDPVIAALADGFIVAWASEDVVLNGAEVHIYARRYDSVGNPLGDEFRVNTSRLICSNPTIAGLSGGGFTVAWSQRSNNRSNNWEIFARSFDALGASSQNAFQVNTYTYGDQFGPCIAAHGNVQVMAWSSLGQDGSFEGVFGRALEFGIPIGEELTNNTITVSRQIHPAIASDGGGRLLVVWSTYRGTAGFDLQAQKYAAGQSLSAPAAPFVSALSASRLSVTWPPVVGFPVTYQVYMDGAQPPDEPTATLVTNMWVKTGLAPASSHSFRIAYSVPGGQTSPLSASSSGITWAEDENMDGLPDDWQEQYWGAKPEDWASRAADSDGDGASNSSEYLAGTDPTDPESVFLTRLTQSEQGRWLEWSTVPGYVYQVQVSTGIGREWMEFGPARFAPGTSDSVLIVNVAGGKFFRISRVR